MLNGYSEEFIRASESRISKLAAMVVDSNDVEKLSDLVEFSHVHDASDPYSTSIMDFKGLQLYTTSNNQ